MSAGGRLARVENGHYPTVPVGSQVALEVWEPFELIADRSLVLHGKVVSMATRSGVDVLWIELESLEERLPGIRFFTANARHHGETVSSLTAAEVMTVHGSFFQGGHDIPASGYIGGLSLQGTHPK